MVRGMALQRRCEAVLGAGAIRVAGAREVLSAFGVVLVLLCCQQSFAQNETFTADPARSTVAFTLADVLHTVHGTFQLQSGAARFDPATGQMSGLLTVAAGSGNSGDKTRDNRMTKEYLDAPHFALATFAPKHFDGTIAASGDSTIQVAGTFTLRGAPHEIVVPMQLHIEGTACKATTHFRIPYVDWGIKDPSVAFIRVNKYVDMDIAMTGTIAAAAADISGR